MSQLQHVDEASIWNLPSYLEYVEAVVTVNSGITHLLTTGELAVMVLMTVMGSTFHPKDSFQYLHQHGICYIKCSSRCYSDNV